jgi:hypothetical protein
MQTAVGQQQVTANDEEQLSQDVSPAQHDFKQMDERDRLRDFLVSNSAEAAEFLLIARTYRHLRSAIDSQYD